MRRRLKQPRVSFWNSTLDFPHFAVQMGVEETLERLGLDDLPGVLIYDADGKLRYRVERDSFEGEMHLEDVEDAIDAVLSGVVGSAGSFRATSGHRCAGRPHCSLSLVAWGCADGSRWIQEKSVTYECSACCTHLRLWG